MSADEALTSSAFYYVSVKDNREWLSVIKGSKLKNISYLWLQFFNLYGLTL